MDHCSDLILGQMQAPSYALLFQQYNLISKVNAV